jgi:hypothetical protein
MKRSIFYVVVLAILFVMMIITTSHADGLRGEAYDTFLPSHIQSTPPVQTASYGGGTYDYGYGYSYDPYGPPLYSPWNSSRCKDCSGVWNGYGCHEFHGPGKHGGCRGHGRECGNHGCNHAAAGCADGGCTASQGLDTTAPVESSTDPETIEPTSPPDPPMPTDEKSASGETAWPIASGLFPVVNN